MLFGRRSYCASLLMILTLAFATDASAVCWVCLFDSGVGEYYCQSVAGSGYASCSPVHGFYCEVTGTNFCEVDGCYCARYPALPLEGDGQPAIRTAAGILLFRSQDHLAKEGLDAVLTPSPVRVEFANDFLTPELAAHLISSRAAGVSPAKLQLAGYAAVTTLGPLSRRLLGDNSVGLLLDARPSSTGQHVRISQLVASSLVEASHEIDLAPHSAALCRVRLGGEDLICVVWAQTLRGDVEAASQTHGDFIKAAEAFPVRALATFTTDSPDLQAFNLGTRRAAPSVWGGVAGYYH